MKPTDLSQLLSQAIPARMPVLIKGAPGVGKTDIVTQACMDTGTELIVSHPVVDEPIDYKGLPYVRDDHAEFLPFGSLRRLIEAKHPTVYFMDDLGQAPPTVQAAAMQLILGRRINGYQVSDQVTFIAATNRKQDKAGVSGILEPVKIPLCHHRGTGTGSGRLDPMGLFQQRAGRTHRFYPVPAPAAV